MVHSYIKLGFIQLAHRRVCKVKTRIAARVRFWVQVHHGLADWINQALRNLIAWGPLRLASICIYRQRVATSIALEINIRKYRRVRGCSDHIRICDNQPGHGIAKVIGTVIAIAASISTGITGFIFQDLGNWQGFLILAGFATAAAALLWVAMPETRPTKYLD